MPDVHCPELLTQTVTYWAPGALNSEGGRAYTTPVQIDGRWAEKVELFTDARGQEKRSLAIVHVEQNVAVDGYLYLGTSAGSDPTVIAGAYPIKRFDKIPGLEAEVFVRKAYL